MAGIAIRQIVSALFERVSKSTEEVCGEGVELGAGQSMPSHTRDAYLLFQVCTVYTIYFKCIYIHIVYVHVYLLTYTSIMILGHLFPNERGSPCLATLVP